MRSSLLALLLVAAACTADTAVAPRRITEIDAGAQLLPAKAYRRIGLPFPGTHSELLDVNDRSQMAGFTGDDAIVLPLNGSTITLDRNGGSSAQARAINASGAVGGWVNTNWQHPAIWATPFLRPHTRPELGWVWDMNDRVEAVGAINNNGTYEAFYWEGKSGLFTVLPFPTGATWAQATGINNDRIVVGLSSAGGVVWRLQAGGWTAKLLKGIDPWAIDAGMGTVGTNQNGRPAWGDPNLAGYLGAGGIANGIHPDGTISGGVSAVVFGQMNAFVANRSGSLTMLPAPPGSQGSQAYNSNRCGLVVGSFYNPSTLVYEATYWDPGC